MLRVLLLALLLAPCSLLLSAPVRPNFVFILVDDLGQRDLGCYGSTFYETPNIDQMAKDGLRFTNAYAACPVCSPTRASILTGKYPQRTGITDYIGAPLKPELWTRNTKLLPTRYKDRLALEEITVAKALKRGGYATFFAGKWHLGPEGWYPEDHGFDINKGGTEQGGPYGGNKYFSPYGNPRLDDGTPGEHLPDRLATETTKFIEANKDRPFFAYLAFYSVHTPLMARKDLEKKYEAKRKQLGLEAKWGREDTRDVRLVQEHAVYAGMVEAMDQAVGKVLRKIDDLDLRKNTIVIFTSDNGGLSTSEGSPTSNAPLRAGKGWLYEGGIREPLIIRWPGTPGRGTDINEPVISPDFYPTILDAAKVPMPSGHPHEGISLAPLIAGIAHPRPRTLYWHYPHYGNQGGAPGTAVRRGDWKLIHWFEGDRYELFNLANDQGEKHDLAWQNAERVVELRKEMVRLHESTGSIDPTPNPAYDPARPNGRAAPPAPKPDAKPAAKTKKKSKA